MKKSEWERQWERTHGRRGKPSRLADFVRDWALFDKDSFVMLFGIGLVVGVVRWIGGCS